MKTEIQVKGNDRVEAGTLPLKSWFYWEGLLMLLWSRNVKYLVCWDFTDEEAVLMRPDRMVQPVKTLKLEAIL